jgi:hypothetical protein
MFMIERSMPGLTFGHHSERFQWLVTPFIGDTAGTSSDQRASSGRRGLHCSDPYPKHAERRKSSCASQLPARRRRHISVEVRTVSGVRGDTEEPDWRLAWGAHDSGGLAEVAGGHSSFCTAGPNVYQQVPDR